MHTLIIILKPYACVSVSNAIVEACLKSQIKLCRQVSNLDYPLGELSSLSLHHKTSEFLSESFTSLNIHNNEQFRLLYEFVLKFVIHFIYSF